MAELSFENAKRSEVNKVQENLTPNLDAARSDTSEDSSTTEQYRFLHYGHRSSYSSDDDDDDCEEDPYQELFMNAYRSAPASSEDSDDGACTNNNTYRPEAKPLSLMEDWELWDCMDDNELRKQLKDHPILLDEITRKRKRKLLDEDDEPRETKSEELSEIMTRFAKYIRTDATNCTS